MTCTQVTDGPATSEVPGARPAGSSDEAGLRRYHGSGDQRSQSAPNSMQLCVQNFTNQSIAVDDLYGPQTEHQWRSLLSSMGLACKSPWSSLSHHRLLLSSIVHHGFNDKAAGCYFYSGCGYS